MLVMCTDRKLTDAKAIIFERIWEYFKEEDLIYSGLVIESQEEQSHASLPNEALKTEISLGWDVKNWWCGGSGTVFLPSVHFCCFNYSPGLVERIVSTYNRAAVCRVIGVQSTCGRSEHAESLSGGK